MYLSFPPTDPTSQHRGRFVLAILLGAALGCDQKGGGLAQSPPDADPDASRDAETTPDGTTDLLPAASLLGGSFLITTDVTRSPHSGQEAYAPDIVQPAKMDRFSISIDTSSPPHLTASRNGRDVMTVPLVPEGNGWRTTSAFGFTYYSPSNYEQGLFSMTYQKVEIHPTPEGLRGTCEGAIEYIFGDVAFHPLFKGTLTGVPSGAADVCTCESPSTRAGLPCACTPGPACQRNMCPFGTLNVLQCRDGVWVDTTTGAIPCGPPGGVRDAGS
jgi:hypothetical protein